MITYKRTLPYSIQIADSFFKRLRGLMFRKTPLAKEGLWITPCNSIHMCFMKFAIDAVFINKEGKIIKTVAELQPWRFVKPVKGAYSVIELPAGTVQKLELKEGEFIEL
ncbi:DUF192 domain-containing protein [Bacillus sp. B15-48]|uniref:DUF192 domain-containing protein n=1 Tax=Bacillus sp. B15-48 TaxID=1548601 RepID=UPI00193F2E4E|nr:DUF192 domain-containing protein [Bacillus sp. B15-48]MBM4764495.1 DUF192 domain-containing protein [Bacillus sp. B15-48]